MEQWLVAGGGAAAGVKQVDSGAGCPSLNPGALSSCATSDKGGNLSEPQFPLCNTGLITALTSKGCCED